MNTIIGKGIVTKGEKFALLEGWTFLDPEIYDLMNGVVKEGLEGKEVMAEMWKEGEALFFVSLGKVVSRGMLKWAYLTVRVERPLLWQAAKGAPVKVRLVFYPDSSVNVLPLST